jgi:hypothetical protein
MKRNCFGLAKIHTAGALLFRKNPEEGNTKIFIPQSWNVFTTQWISTQFSPSSVDELLFDNLLLYFFGSLSRNTFSSPSLRIIFHPFKTVGKILLMAKFYFTYESFSMRGWRRGEKKTPASRGWKTRK